MYKCFRIIACVVGIVMLLGCSKPANPEDSLPTTTPVPVSAADLLADALKYYEAGDYEEAIIAYMGAIEIEPRNIEAQIGLGRAYRNAGKNEEAITVLLAAREMDSENREAAVELGYVYLAAEQFAEAEEMANSAWRNGQGGLDAGMLLLASLISQGKMEEAAGLMESRAPLNRMLEQASWSVSTPYIGGLDENGKPSGWGIDMGNNFYCGEYEAGLRSGQGTLYVLSAGVYYTGAWENDMPNGYGEYYVTATNTLRTGQYVDGLEDGERTQVDGEMIYTYTANMGKPVVLDVTTHNGFTFYHIAYAETDTHSGTLSATDPDQLWGVLPWGQ